MQKIKKPSGEAVKSFTYQIIILSLIISGPLSYSPTLRADICTYQDVDSRLEENMTTCNATSGMEWSCSLNRCLNSVQMTDLRENLATCEEMEDETEKKTCFDTAAAATLEEDHPDIDLTPPKEPNKRSIWNIRGRSS